MGCGIMAGRVEYEHVAVDLALRQPKTAGISFVLRGAHEGSHQITVREACDLAKKPASLPS